MATTGNRSRRENEWSSPESRATTSGRHRRDDMRNTDSGVKSTNETSRIVTDGGLKAGQQEVDGEVFEYPFRVEDFHGEAIRDDLDTIPPFLNQQEIDILASELETRFENGIESGLHEQTLVEVLRKLPDSEYGRDALPAWIVRESDECEIVTDGGRPEPSGVEPIAGEVVLSWVVEQTATDLNYRIVVAPAGADWVVLRQKRRGISSEWQTVKTHDASEKPTVPALKGVDGDD